MKKETFVKIMRNLIKHIEDSEKIGQSLKESLKTRSSIIEDFSDGLDLIFYDDTLVDNVIDSIRDEFNDTEGFITCWFYEYRTMGVLRTGFMTVTETSKDGSEKEWSIGTDPDNDEKNLSDLYDMMKEYYD